MTDDDLVVHLGTSDPRVLDRTTGHVRVPIWPRPGPLPGADLVVAHGAIALVVGVVRTRRHGVRLHYRPTGRGVDAAIARLLGVPSAEALSEPAHRATPVPPTQLHLGDRLDLLPTATRHLGTRLLVADADPDRVPMELTGTGPQVWYALGSGATLGDVVRNLIDSSGGPPDEVEQSVLLFARSLVDAGLAERA